MKIYVAASRGVGALSFFALWDYMKPTSLVIEGDSKFAEQAKAWALLWNMEHAAADPARSASEQADAFYGVAATASGRVYDLRAEFILAGRETTLLTVKQEGT